MYEEFLQIGKEESPTIDFFVNKSLEKFHSHKSEINLIHDVGKSLIDSGRLWIPSESASVDISKFKEPINRDGIYFNGKNKVEVFQRISEGSVKFWNNYSSISGIPLTLPDKLLKHFENTNSIGSWTRDRTPEQILTQQYIGKSGGCGGYVKIMTDILRKCDIPTKVIFCLQDPLDRRDGTSEMEIAASGDLRGERIGHWLIGSFVEGDWRLFDAKWQWNPNYKQQYRKDWNGLRDPRHRRNYQIRYIPVTNNGVYTTGEDLGSPNIGRADFRVDTIYVFARDFLEKTTK